VAALHTNETLTCDLCGRTVSDNDAWFKMGMLCDSADQHRTGTFQLVVTCHRDACTNSPRFLGRESFDRRTWRRLCRDHRRQMLAHTD
jgi:hypothetical protein